MSLSKNDAMRIYKKTKNIENIRKKTEILREIRHRRSEIIKHMKTLKEYMEKRNILECKDIKNYFEKQNLSSYNSIICQLRNRISYLEGKIKELNKKHERIRILK